MNIVLLNRTRIENMPPLISAAIILRELGHDVIIITAGITERNMDFFNKKGVSVRVVPYNATHNPIPKLLGYIKYRRTIDNILKSVSFDFVWIEGSGAFRVLAGIVDKYKYVMQISEMYDLPSQRKARSSIKRLISDAIAVVMPEYNRATLYQVQYRLPLRPFVLPNKPYFELDKKDFEECEKKYAEQLEVFYKKKVILYQGIIAKERDLSNYIKPLKELGNEYQLVLLGKDYGMVDAYKKIDPNIIHLDFIPAPDYLVFTSKAYIGIISYDQYTINTAYCAPNKIYEYGRFGLPMIGNDIPGLRNTIGYYNAGVIVDEDAAETIKSAIMEINNSYLDYSANAKRLYDDTDNVESIKKILSFVSKKLSPYNGTKKH